MSNILFPNYLPGILFTPKKSPTFNTGVHLAVTGKESRLSYRAYPLYQWELSYELLRDYADGRVNYIAYSQDGTQWTPSASGAPAFPAVGVPNYATAPDGTLTATRLIMNSPGAASTQYSSVAISAGAYPPIGSTVTGSVWMKTNDGSTVNVTIQVSYMGNVLCRVTPQWQRFSVTGITFASGGSYFPSFFIYNQPAIGASQYADISAWGAQVEVGAFASPYIPTRGVAVAAGDLKSMFGLFSQMLGQQDTFLYQDPDFNTVSLQPFAQGNGSIASFPLTAQYMPGNSYPAPYGLAGLPELIQNSNGAPQIYTLRYGGPELLSAGTRTNLALQAKFAASWNATLGTLNANTIAAPDGTVTAAAFVDSATTGAHFVSQTQTGVLTANGRYTFSVWLRIPASGASGATPRYVTLFLEDNLGNNGVAATFDLLNGVVSQAPVPFGNGYYASAADAQVSGPYPAGNFSTNGFYRCSISAQCANANVGLVIAASTVPNPGLTVSYTGTNSTVFYCWGAQLEAGTQPTGLIPTTVAAANNGVNDYTLSATNMVTPNGTLANGVQWAWSGSFYYRNRFGDDSMDFAEFLYQFWELKSLKMQQEKL